jgi:spore coat polysaccharide biosynthesis protein SpsF
MPIGVFMQVRLGSTRLPMKALLPIQGISLIRHAMRALRGVPADVLALLTDAQSASRLEIEAMMEGFDTFVGPDFDVLERYCMACRNYSVTTVIRATGDNPLVSACLAREILRLHEESGADLSHFLGCPVGTGIEVVEAKALFTAEMQAEDPAEREHCTTYMYRHRERFKILEPQAPEGMNAPEARVSVDTPEDYTRVEKIYHSLYREAPIEADAVVSWFVREAWKNGVG